MTRCERPEPVVAGRRAWCGAGDDHGVCSTMPPAHDSVRHQSSGIFIPRTDSVVCLANRSAHPFVQKYIV